MKAVKWFAPRDMRVVEVEKPVPKPHEALLRIESVGICGSDIHNFLEGGIGSATIADPLVLGHEFGGIVEDVGADADKGLIGKRVAVEPGIPCSQCEWCRRGDYNVCPDLFFPGLSPDDGCLCEYFAVHAAFCFPVPDALGPREAAMMEPLAVAIHTVELGRVKPGETGAILGLGPIGLLTAQVAKFAGINAIYGTDLLDYRVEAGKKYGVDFAFNARAQDTVETIMRETNGRGVDVAFDTARSSDTPSLACKVARRSGRCVLTGISGRDDDPLPVSEARRKELTVRWCRRFKHNFPAALALAVSGKIDVSSLLTHSFPLEETSAAFELVAESRDNVLKASVDI